MKNNSQILKIFRISTILVFICQTTLLMAEKPSLTDTNDLVKDTLKEIPDRLPQFKNSFIEKANNGLKPSGFKFRGIKGLAWTPEQYLEEIPVLAKYKMNFLMNCYLSMFSVPPVHGADWATAKNEWWLPLTDARKQAYQKVFKKAKEYGIDFCFSIHAQLFSSRPANLSSEKDFEDLWQHYAWAQSQGIHWFSVPIDDVNFYAGKDIKISGEEHALFVNKLLARLRKKDKNVQLIFCPTYYGGVGEDPKEKAYLQAIAKFLDKDVFVFWTGPATVPAICTAAEAKKFKDLVGHRMFLWDNYPVNDNATNTVHLAPLTGRDKDLPAVIDGYMSNSLSSQNEINRVPLFTIADYTYDPSHYDPKVSIGQAITHQSDDQKQREILLEVTKLYANEIKGTGFNPVVDHFDKITAAPFSKYIADMYIGHIKKVQKDLDQEFPKQYRALKQTFVETLNIINDKYKKKYSANL